MEQKDYEKVEKIEHLFWSQDCEAIFQPREAGHISPRNLVKAQKVLAKQSNCHILSDALVTKIRKSDETDSGLFIITIKRQNSIHEVCNFSAKQFNFITRLKMLFSLLRCRKGILG